MIGHHMHPVRVVFATVVVVVITATFHQFSCVAALDTATTTSTTTTSSTALIHTTICLNNTSPTLVVTEHLNQNKNDNNNESSILSSSSLNERGIGIVDSYNVSTLLNVGSIFQHALIPLYFSLSVCSLLIQRVYVGISNLHSKHVNV